MSGTQRFGSGLLPQHVQLLTASRITPDVARQRGYVSAQKKVELERRGFGVRQRWVPALVIPIHDVWGQVTGYQARPDDPRVVDGRVRKYETPIGTRMVIDCPPAVRPHLGDPGRPLVITEGARKADAAVVAGLDCVALLGVWNWRGTNGAGGKVALPDWEVIALNDRQVYVAFDSDVMLKPQVDAAMRRLVAFLERLGANVAVIYLPSGQAGAKVGLDDYLAEHDRDELLALATPDLRPLPGDDDARHLHLVPASEPPPRCSLAEVDAAFDKWMNTPDLDVLHAVLAAVVANRCPGDPVWLMLVGPPSVGKTELLMPVSTLPDCHVIGRVSVAGLLSGTAQKEQAPDATGGMLRVLGDRGVLVIKDFGAVLALNRDQRADVLQAFRDVYDGRFDRNVGADGGRQLVWRGHAGMVAATTPAFDDHYGVISALGDRYVLLRLNLGDAEQQAVTALEGAGDETAMRDELADVVGGFLGHLDVDQLPALDEQDRRRVARLGTLASHCRSVVIRDSYSREIINVHQPEQPARLTKQLGRILAALRVIGLAGDDSWRVVTRCGLDCIPPTRRRVLAHLADAGQAVTTKAMAEALGLPTSTVRRAAEDLAAHKAVERNQADATPSNRDVWSLTKWARARWMAVPVPEMSEGEDPPCARVSSQKSLHTEDSTHDDFSGKPTPERRGRLVIPNEAPA